MRTHPPTDRVPLWFPIAMIVAFAASVGILTLFVWGLAALAQMAAHHG